jgi:hypothetical protein
MIRYILFFILITHIFISENQALTDKNTDVSRCKKKRCIHIHKPKGITCPEGPEGATGATGPLGPTGPTGIQAPNLPYGFVYSTTVQEIFVSTIVNFENSGPFDASETLLPVEEGIEINSPGTYQATYVLTVGTTISPVDIFGNFQLIKDSTFIPGSKRPVFLSSSFVTFPNLSVDTIFEVLPTDPLPIRVGIQYIGSVPVLLISAGGSVSATLSIRQLDTEISD